MINFAIIGCGKIANRHAGLLGNNQIKDAKLAAACDLNKNKAEELASKYNIPYYTDIDKMFDKEKIDVVNILTPSGLHAQNAIHAALNKKHVVVEKPMALSLADADKMIITCDKMRVKLFVVNQNRFNLPIIKLKEALETDRFGKLVMGTVRVRWCRKQEYYDRDKWRGTWAYDGGVLTNQASHHIDMLEWMMGDVKSVFAKGITALNNIEVEDTAACVIKFYNGSLGIIEATTATRPKDLEGSISILGEKGSVEIGGFAMNQINTWQFEDSNKEDELIIKNFSSNPADEYGYAHRVYLNHVTDSIINNKQSLVDGLEGRRSLELISAIYESIETNREIYLKFEPKKCRLGQR